MGIVDAMETRWDRKGWPLASRFAEETRGQHSCGNGYLMIEITVVRYLPGY